MLFIFTFFKILIFFSNLEKSKEETKVIDGNPVEDIARFPYIVHMFHISSANQKTGSIAAYAVCTATYLKTVWVLTAAHCVAETESNVLLPNTTFYLKMGRSRTAEALDIRISVKVLMHEKYNSSDMQVNDVALIKIDSPFRIGKRIKVVKLLFSDEYKSVTLKKDMKVTIVGYGLIKYKSPEDTEATDILRTINSLIMVPDDGPFHVIKVGPQMACRGDSGGPLILYVDNVPVQLGIGSYVVSNTTEVCKGATIYEPVTKHKEWIEKRVPLHEEDKKESPHPEGVDDEDKDDNEKPGGQTKNIIFIKLLLISILLPLLMLLIYS